MTTYNPQSDLAEIGVEYIPRICASLAVTYSPALGCSPFERFYGPDDYDTEFDRQAVAEPGQELPTQFEVERRLDEQTRAHHEAVRRRARDRVNSGRKAIWYAPGKRVTLKSTGLLGLGTIRPIYAGEAYIGSEENIEVVSEEGAGVVEAFPELFSSLESSYQGDALGDAQGSPTWPDRLLAEQLDDEEAGEVRYYGGGGSPTGSGTPLMYQERGEPSGEPQPAADSPTLSDRPLIEQVCVVEPMPMSDAASEPPREARSEQSLNEQMAEILNAIGRMQASPTESERPLIDQLREEHTDDNISDSKSDPAPEHFRQPEISDYSSSEEESPPEQ
ncbi:hypothetical protein GGI00_002785 [Coemansia sp. RSA 2681]|nr:hypothetical protein GGI00_002785 [Coemansia sp. RSA 2681]